PAPAADVPAAGVAPARDGADGRGDGGRDRDRARRNRAGERARRGVPPMRIVHLVIGGDVAGGQVVALQLARAARERGDEVACVAPEHGPFTELAAEEGFRVEVLPLRRTFQLAAAWRLARLLRRRRIDLLHTHTLAAANVLARLAGASARVPVVSHLHIENHFRPATRRLLVGLDNATARPAARLVAVSEDTQRAHAPQGYPPARLA